MTGKREFWGIRDPVDPKRPILAHKCTVLATVSRFGIHFPYLTVHMIGFPVFEFAVLLLLIFQLYFSEKNNIYKGEPWKMTGHVDSKPPILAHECAVLATVSHHGLQFSLYEAVCLIGIFLYFETQKFT
jgi:hypothetical protein